MKYSVDLGVQLFRFFCKKNNNHLGMVVSKVELVSIRLFSLRDYSGSDNC